MDNHLYLEVDEVAQMWHCTSAKIVRMVRHERLRPIIVVNDKAYFDPAAVARVLGVPVKPVKTGT